MPLNEKLKMAILKSGHPQYVIATRSKINPAVLSEVVNGKRILVDKEKARLARELRTTIQELDL